MRSLRQYIAESVHQYDYTIKIVGELPSDWVELFKYNLQKFDPIEIKGPTATPIQKFPVGFAEFNNQPVNIFKCNFRYPATEPMIRQMAQLLGMDENRVRVVGTAYSDSLDTEASQYENQIDSSPVLTSDYPDDKAAKEAAAAYGNSYLDSIQEQHKESKIEFDIAGDDVPDAEFDPFKPDQYAKTSGKESPMSKITRPTKPKTGNSK